jgi:hypothetical protein
MVKTETKFLDFLRTDDFDPWKAAKRLALYWKYRKYYFGERWLLPMTQTGSGALSMEDVKIMRTGYSVFLPRQGKTTVLLMDLSRLGDSGRTAHPRVSMYLSTVCTTEWTQVEGVTGIHVVTSAKRPLAEVAPDLRAQQIACFPFKFKNAYVVQAYEEGKKHLVEYLAYQTYRIMEQNIRVTSEYIAADSVEGTCHMLESRGFSRDCFPRCLGGDYDYRLFDEWCRMQARIEESPLVVPSVASAMTDPRGLSTEPLIKRSRTDGGEEEGEDDFVRKRNALYSRRMYHKRKTKLVLVQEQCKVWETRNNTLKEESYRLQGLLVEARYLVSVHCAAEKKAAQEGPPSVANAVNLDLFAMDEAALTELLRGPLVAAPAGAQDLSDAAFDTSLP